MARSGIPRRSKAPRFGDGGRGRRGTTRGSETEGSRIATNSTRVTNAADLAKQGRRPNAAEVSGSGRRPEDILVYVERSHGRADDPGAKVSRPRQIGRMLTGHTSQQARTPTRRTATLSRRAILNKSPNFDNTKPYHIRRDCWYNIAQRRTSKGSTSNEVSWM